MNRLVLTGVFLLVFHGSCERKHGSLLQKIIRDLEISNYDIMAFSDYAKPLPGLIETLTEKDIGNRKIFVIGDIHGCFDEFQALLKKIDYQSGQVLVLLAGDFFNKGPRGIDVLRYIRSHGNIIAVRGNNEDKVNWETYTRHYLNPKANFSKSNEAAYELSSREEQWLRHLPYALRIPSKNAIVVHAGIVPGTRLEDNSKSVLANIRKVLYAGDVKQRWSACKGDDKALCKVSGTRWATLWQGPETVFFAHNAREGLQQEKHAIGLDTGCVYGRSLTGAWMDTRETVSVDCKEYAD